MSAPIFGKPYVTALPGLLSASAPGAYVLAPNVQAEDVTLYRDGTLVPAGLSNLPVNDPAGSPRLRVQFSAEEMSSQEVILHLHSADGMWSDVILEIHPHSSENAGYVDLVLGLATDDSTAIRIRKTGVIAEGPQAYGVRLRMEVIEASGIDKEIFVYQKRPLDLTKGTFVGDFNHICSPTDLGNYPVDDVSNEVDLNPLPAFYRSVFVDLLFDSITAADEFERVFWEDIYLLKRNMDRLRRLQVPQIVTVGGIAGAGNIQVDFPAPPPPPTPTYGGVESTQATPTFVRCMGAKTVPWDVSGQTVVLAAGENSQFLILQDCDFSAIPASARLVGLKVDLNFASSPPGRLEYLKFNLPDGPAGDNLAADVAEPTDGSPTHSYALSKGGSSDLLGTAATVADVKRGEFGLMALVDAPYGETVAAITAVTITAYWTPIAT